MNEYPYVYGREGGREGGKEGGRAYLLDRGAGVTQGVDQFEDDIGQLLGDVVAASRARSGDHLSKETDGAFFHLPLIRAHAVKNDLQNRAHPVGRH